MIGDIKFIGFSCLWKREKNEKDLKRNCKNISKRKGNRLAFIEYKGFENSYTNESK